jgi:hypothetical protein
MCRWLGAVNQRCRLKDANFVLVGCGDLARVGAAVESRDADVVVNCAGNDLYTFECTGENDYVAARCVRLGNCESIKQHFRASLIMTSVNKTAKIVYKVAAQREKLEKLRITSGKKKKKNRENTIKRSGEDVSAD